MSENGRVNLERNGTVVASGVRQENRIYRMLFRVVWSENEANVTAASFRVWHERLGNVGKSAVRDLVKRGSVDGVSMKDEKDFFCEACQLGKSHRLPFKKCIDVVKTEPGEKIHTDVCGPMSVDSLGGARFFVTFKDDSTGYRHIYFIKHKSDVFDKLKEYARLVENKFGKKIKVLRSDNGGELVNAKKAERNGTTER